MDHFKKKMSIKQQVEYYSYRNTENEEKRSHKQRRWQLERVFKMRFDFD